MSENWEESRKSFSLLSLRGRDSNSGGLARIRDGELLETTKITLAKHLGIDLHQFPEIEPNPEIHQFLNKFCHWLDCNTITAEMKEAQVYKLEQEYQKEEIRIQEQLKLMGMTKDQLPVELQNKLTFLARLAEKLELPGIRFSALVAKWSDLCLRHMEITETERMLSSVLDTSTMIKEKTIKMKEQTDRAFEGLSRTVNGVRLPTQMQSEVKIQEYQSEAQAFKEMLEQRGYTEQISHQELEKKAGELEGMKKEVDQMCKELRKFDVELPRDIDAAKIRVTELQTELAKVTATIRSKMV